ncbi:sigma-70 family RNA polymerase sigma factor [Aeromicrobium sp. NPDC092404]|uniref:sigma-70 family RNA polymerase sigma factor n=1 Tax=Aeromicrobium sp. NPDC092404 TaxID=3154976 RepID=UPI00343166CD
MPEDQDELLRALHDAHAPALLRYVTRLTYDPALAQDVVQEALFRAWRRPAILEQGEAASRAWLFTVARNLVIDDRRTARHLHEVTSERLPETSRADGTDAALDRWLVSDALRSLSPEHRHAIVNTYYLGRSAAEFAREEGIPEGTVRSRMHYALRALRLAMQERGVTR